MENLFIKGGIFMWPLLFSLFTTLIIFFERCLYWLKTKSDNSDYLKVTAIDSQNYQALVEAIKYETEDETIQLAYQSLLKKQLSQSEIDSLLKQKQLSHNRFMRLLDVIISVAPLLGILGTIWGIISSFNLAGLVNEIEPSTAMIGMSEAFITTAFGLVVSLSALFAYNYFQSLAEKDLITNDIFLSKILVKIKSNE